MSYFYKLKPLMKDYLIKLPCPSSLTYMWSFGSLLGLFLSIQILSGIFLSIHYSSNINSAFESVIHINFDVNWGWLLRYTHANGATFFFFFIYFHIGRGLFYSSFNLSWVWMLGIMIFLIFMGVAFMGYVLPWGQMSFWGATVITNLISALPWLGKLIVEWVWGGFSVSEPTLMRFFSFHFILPFCGLMLVICHLIMLHETGSNNPLGLSMNSDKVCFHPFFSIKDLMGFMIIFFLFGLICLYSPYLFMDPDNFIEANSLVTPIHIQPEWYFLFAYAILRSIPSKLGGVITMLLSIMILMVFVLMKKEMNVQKSKVYEILCIMQYNVFVILTWIGSLPVEDPYLMIGQLSSLMYFMIFFLMLIL